MTHLLAQRVAGTRIQFHYLPLQPLGLCFAQLHAMADAVPALVDEIVIRVPHQRLHLLLPSIAFQASYLDEQTFLQRAGTDTGRVKLPQDVHETFQLLGAGGDTLIYLQFIGHLNQAFLQKAVIVERADEVFHHLLLVFAEVVFAHLCLQLIIEGECVAILDVLGSVAAIVGSQEIVGHIILATIVAKHLADSILGRLALYAIVSAVARIIVLRLTVSLMLQPGIFQALVLHTLSQCVQRHLCQTYGNHLLGRQRLLLHLLLALHLLLCLYVSLAHFVSLIDLRRKITE